MNYKLSHPTNIVNCEINLPSSKSISNRLLIIKSICNNNFSIDNLSESDDTKILNKSLNSKEYLIDVNHAGTSFRFLTAFLSTQTDKEFILTGSERMKQRPIKDLVNALRYLGAKIEYLEEENFPPLKIKGTNLSGDYIEINGSISSQFISSLLLIAPCFENGLTIKIKGRLVSKSYVQMTLRLMEEFGINWIWENDKIFIKNQDYIVKKFRVESDWSAATFWFQIAALSDKCNIRLNGLKINSIQGDNKVLDIFKSLGVNIEYDIDSFVLTKSQNITVQKSYNLLSNPDIYQSLKCTIFGLKKNTNFTGISNLIYKESNRILSTENELKKLHTTKEINTYNDHRMAMCFAPLCMKFGILQINNVSVVCKSYPYFWNDLKKGGFKISS